ncbi:hypothetical protein CMI37_38355 [Candidatus Pacearchaeota archaeon]|nr:hypothetical protein [Candidatus Pacearchaeota archaeon]
MPSSLTDIVLRNLQLIRSRTPSVAEANTWVEEFNRKLGSADPERLQAAFDAAREEAAGSARYRPLHFDDIAASYRRTNSPGDAAPDGPPTDPNCRRRCGDGKVAVRDGKGYEVLALCDCDAGRWWAGQPAWGSYPSVSDLLSTQRFKEPEEDQVSQAQAEWLRDRTGQVGIKQALAEFTAEMDRRAGR